MFWKCKGLFQVKKVFFSDAVWEVQYNKYIKDSTHCFVLMTICLLYSNNGCVVRKTIELAGDFRYRWKSILREYLPSAPHPAQPPFW
jgi:hypothetical protein